MEDEIGAIGHFNMGTFEGCGIGFEGNTVAGDSRMALPPAATFAPTDVQPEQWIVQMGVDNLPRGRYQPWYHVLVDVRDRAPAQMTYVCHENIMLWLDPPDEGVGPLGPIDHPDVRRAFTGYDRADRRYVMPHIM